MAGDQSALVTAWYHGNGWLVLLRPVEFIFRGLAALRRYLYKSGIRSTWHSPKPVVIIGNITVGGTGKTPVVIALVEYLQAQGIHPGVVSRGYGATSGIFPHRVTADSTVADCGDESLLIYQRTSCPCVVAPDRVAAVRYLLDSSHVDIVISDDGLQHYALGRDMEIAVLDEKRRLGNGYCLPAGPLREPPSRLKEVDYVVYRGGTNPANGVTYEYRGLVNLVTGEHRELAPGVLAYDVHAVAGIGQPAQFFDTLTARGFNIQAHEFPDHHMFTRNDFTSLGDKPIVMTEKDAVKCRDIAGDDAWYLKIEAVLPDLLKASVARLAQRQPLK